jgi:hypothetical protein
MAFTDAQPTCRQLRRLGTLAGSEKTPQSYEREAAAFGDLLDGIDPVWSVEHLGYLVELHEASLTDDRDRRELSKSDLVRTI